MTSTHMFVQVVTYIIKKLQFDKLDTNYQHLLITKQETRVEQKS